MGMGIVWISAVIWLLLTAGAVGWLTWLSSRGQADVYELDPNPYPDSEHPEP